MTKPSPLNLVLPLLAAALACQAQPSGQWQIEGTTAQSHAQSLGGGNTNIFLGGVLISNQTAVVTSDEAVANELNGEVQATGDVTILEKGHFWRGTNVIYNFKTGQIRSDAFKTVQAPFNVTGQILVGDTNHVYAAARTTITTDDYAHPAYLIRAKEITIVPGVFFEAREATVYWGPVPVFYFPHYKRYLNRHPNFWEFSPGYRSLFGAYLLSAYHWYWNDSFDGAFHFDLRQTRGLAGGPDLNFHMGEYGDAAFRYYYAHDQDPSADGFGPVPPQNRQRVAFLYDDTSPTNNTSVKVSAFYQSDPLIIRDFFESEYKANIQPSSVAEASHAWSNFNLDLMVQPQLVNFFETVERLPDLQLNGYRQQIGATPIYYESQSSVGYYRRAFSDTNNPFFTTNLLGGPSGLYSVPNIYGNNRNYAGTRADTFHQFTMPQTFFGWLNVTPRVGGRLTYYGATDGGVRATNAQVRGVFNTGIDFSFKASRVWENAESKFWDVNGLRHIIEPELDYGYIPSPTRSPSQIPQYDYEAPSLRLLPIEFPEYNSIDSIDSQNVIRLMLRNRLQTKRSSGVEDLVNWALYTDLNVDPRTNQTRFADFYSDLNFRPRSWLTFASSTRFDISNTRFVDSANNIIIEPSSALSVALGYRYLMNNDPEFQTFPGETIPGHNLISASVYYRLNENWAAHIAERFEAQNGTFQEQDYSIYRDMRSWTAALTFRMVESQGGPTDFSVALTFSLKAFPRFHLDSDSDHPAMLLGGSPPIETSPRD